jgi:hypothetical protein
MTNRFCLSLQLLVLVAAALEEQFGQGDFSNPIGDGDLMRADIDATSFNAIRLHEDTDFS